MKLQSIFFFPSRERQTKSKCDWSSEVCSPILARLNNLTRRFDISFGSDALSEIAMEAQEHRLPRSRAAITEYCTALTLLLRKVVSFFGLSSSKGRREEQQRNPKDGP